MEALRQLETSRQVLGSLETSVGLRGVRVNDEMVLDIFQERKRSFKLNRTKYLIAIDKKFEFDFKNSIIKFPVFRKESGEFQLELVPNFQAKNHSEKSRYILKSLGDIPFRLNGAYCFEAFLERGDVVDIGFNRIHFLKNYVGDKNEKKIPEKIIRGQISILLEGETGTGKTTLAKKIHEESGRSGNFVHINLSAFSPSLIESEIFGHVKGAFTGAMVAKRGAILEAHKGTLFLDEIDSLTLDLQTKLLVFLDDYRVRAVGGEHTQKVDVRMIFASGTVLKKKVETEKMRIDFYYRLQAGYSFFLDSLRTKKEKIRDICHAFEQEQAVVVSEDAINFYLTCGWPGNIRQLQGHLQKKKIFSDGKKIVLDELDQELLSDNFNLNKLETREVMPLEMMKISYCYEVYLKLDRNITKTARILEMSCNTLKSYLRKKEGVKDAEKIDLSDEEITDIDF